jgi:hypothetical protein
MAGRGKPKGLPKSGGRQKGAVDKIKREAILAAQGITPLDYMMMLVRAETPPGLDPAIARTRETLRFEAAKAAAPYVHARLQAVTLGGDPENPRKAGAHLPLKIFVSATYDAHFRISPIPD